MVLRGILGTRPSINQVMDVVGRFLFLCRPRGKKLPSSAWTACMLNIRAHPFIFVKDDMTPYMTPLHISILNIMANPFNTNYFSYDPISYY